MSFGQLVGRNIALLKCKANFDFHFCKYDCFFKFKAIDAKGICFVLGTSNNCFGIIMVNTCVAAYCKTGYKKRQHKINVIPEKSPVFCFLLKNPELNRKCIRFVNRRDWAPTRRSGVCSKHFKEKFWKVGKRATLQ